MSSRARTIAALAVAVVILSAGISYVLERSPSYESSASLVLTPTTKNPSELPTVFDGFTASGASGTFVELLSSPDTLRAAGSPPVSIAVRAVPDTRVISVTASGGKDAVRPGLDRLVNAARASGGKLRDLWSLNVLASPSPAVVSGPKTSLILLATILLAALGALFVLVVLGRLGAEASGGDVLPGPGSGTLTASRAESRRRARRSAGG
jgi:hypothetical protein